MRVLFEHFITQSVAYSFIIVTLVTFFESLALVGLILPGTVMMTGLGTLIGNGDINFWKAWTAGIIGCLLGDWFSFWLGWHFKKPLCRWSLMKKNKAILDKAKYALQKHNVFTILVGRFIGPTRPLVIMAAGMLNLPIEKFIVPNIIGCLFWPLFYFLPGILVGATINISSGEQSNSFKWILLFSGLALWITIWIFWKLWYSEKASCDFLARYLPRRRLLWLAPIALGIVIITITALVRHPLMPSYSKILLRIVSC